MMENVKWLIQKKGRFHHRIAGYCYRLCHSFKRTKAE